MIDNYLGMGVYILHGDKDDNVPVEQARTMKDLLTKAGHTDLGYHEQPGAGHWWGNECVDWPAIFDMFRRRTIPVPSEIDNITFVTADPGVSDRLHWLRIESQQQRLVPTRVQARVDRAAKSLIVTTTNAAAVAFDAGSLGLAPACSIEINGTKLTDLKPGKSGLIRVVREGNIWKDASAVASSRTVPQARSSGD